MLEDTNVETVVCFFVLRRMAGSALPWTPGGPIVIFTTLLTRPWLQGTLKGAWRWKRERLHLALADLKDAFYQLGMPEQWRLYFGLRQVRAGTVGIKQVNGKPVLPDTLPYPRLQAIPMGWSWALYWCQHAVQTVLSTRSSCSVKHRVADGRAPPESRSGNFLYIDYLSELLLSSKSQN